MTSARGLGDSRYRPDSDGSRPTESEVTAGRAPFSRIAGVLGVSDRTVAHRYHRVHITDAVHVISRLDSRRPEADWLIRLHCTPGAAMATADILARRTDISGVTIMSGKTEVLCVARTRTIHEPNELPVDELTRTDHVVSVTAHRVLHTFLDRQPHWSGILTALTQAQCGALRAAIAQSALIPRTAFGSQPGDEALLGVLARDGRAGFRELAAATGWSQTTVKRRLGSLRRTGSLHFDLECDASLLGIEMTARLRMSVAPSGLADVGAALAEHPETAFAAATTGPANLRARSADRADGTGTRSGATSGGLGRYSASAVRSAPARGGGSRDALGCG
jgi:hypothetical protein